MVNQGDFLGEMNGPIFAQSIAARVMRLMAETLVGQSENTTGISTGPARHITVVTDEEFLNPDVDLLAHHLPRHLPPNLQVSHGLQLQSLWIIPTAAVS